MKKLLLYLVMVCCGTSVTSAVPLPMEKGKLPTWERPERRISVGKNSAAVLTGKNTLIVISPNAGKVTRFAAEELKRFLSQVLGCDIKIVDKPGAACNIFVGDGEFARSKSINIAALPRDGFFIRTFGKNILVAGRDDSTVDPAKALQGGVWAQHYERGSLFAVYDFLERFADCRFYFPGELGTIIPQKQSINVPECDIFDRPDLLYRKYSTYWDGIYFEGKDRHKKVLPTKTLNAYRLRMESAYYPSNHGMNNFCLLKRFADSNPEYFALGENGKRRNQKSGSFTGHICWSSPVVDVIYEDIKAYLTGKSAASRNITLPNGKPGWTPYTFRDLRVDVMPQDGFYLCRCKDCQAKAQTPEELNDMIWTQVIKWANQLKKENIPGTLTMMAYYPYYMVPEQSLPDNLEVNIADTGAWNNNGTPSARAPRHKGVRVRPAGIKAWHDALKRPVDTWNYMYKNYANEMPGIPAPSPLAVGKYYSQVVPYLFGAYMASNCDRFLYYAMNYYIFSKLAWNKNADYKAIMREHYQLMYGKAADEMQSLMEEFESLWIRKVVGKVIDTAAGPVNSMPSEQEIWSSIYSPAKRSELEKRFEKALKLATPGTLEHKRIELYRREFMEPMHRRAAGYAKSNQSANIMKIVEDSPVILNRSGNQQGKLHPVQTVVWVKRSGGNLLVHFECEEPFMDKVEALQRSFDDPGTFRDNDVEFFINPSGDRKNYYQFIVNSTGALTDYRCVSAGKPVTDISYNSNAKVKVSRSDKGFTVDLTIPLTSLKDFKINHAAVNFGRSRVLDRRKDYENMYVLSPQGKGFHDIDNFYRLVERDKELVYDGSFSWMREENKNGKRIWRYRKHVAWSQFNNSKSYCTLDDKVFFSKPYSMKIVSGDSKGNFVWLTLPKLKPSTRYRLSAMVKLENVTPVNRKGGFALMLRDNKNHFFPDANKHKGSGEWFAVSNEFVTDMLAGEAPDSRLLPRLFSASGTVWVDDLSLEEIK